VIDCALPATMFNSFQNALRPSSPFWAEHRYHDPATGYFSYVLPTTAIGPCSQPETQASVSETQEGRDQCEAAAKKAKKKRRRKDLSLEESVSGSASPSQSLVEAVVAVCRAHVAAWAPEVDCERAGSTTAEWWAHCRCHSSGHQLHFDSAFEGETSGGAQNPLVSCVLYLSTTSASTCASSGEVAIGGPTLVTNQRLTDTNMATRGHLVRPKENRLCMFKGDLLHCVLPGRGTIDDAESARRVTFMVAFWPRMKSQPYDPSNKHTKWPAPAVRLPSLASLESSPPVSSLALKWPLELLRPLTREERKEAQEALSRASPPEGRGAGNAGGGGTTGGTTDGRSSFAVANPFALEAVAPVWERLAHVYFPKITKFDGDSPVFPIAPYEKCFQGF